MRERRAGAAAATFAALLAVLLTAGCKPVDTGSQRERAELDRLVARCTDAMVRDVCIAKRQSANASPAASQVFVAGVGAIDATAYSEIRAAGEAMCGLIRTRCSEGWNDKACVAARSLWPPTTATTKVSSAR